jgi:hypothetical protein
MSWRFGANRTLTQHPLPWRVLVPRHSYEGEPRIVDARGVEVAWGRGIYSEVHGTAQSQPGLEFIAACVNTYGEALALPNTLPPGLSRVPANNAEWELLGKWAVAEHGKKCHLIARADEDATAYALCGLTLSDFSAREETAGQVPRCRRCVMSLCALAERRGGTPSSAI